MCEAAIDALSLAAIEGAEEDTAYVSTVGGWGDGGRAAISQLLLAAHVVVAATDQGTGGDLLAGRLEDLARTYGISFERQRPAAKDWNDQLVGERYGGSPRQDESVGGR